MKEKNNQNEKTIDYSLLSFNVSKRYLAAKRLFDVIGAIFGIILLSPVFFVTAIAIKLDSGGPVFYCQDRCGLNSKTFKIYKFRSMVMKVDKRIKELESRNEAGSKMFKIKNDPRITKIGKFIRRTSIDEMPQFLNVLKGEMSLVGPRPPLVLEAKNYDPWHRLRLSVKPGMTGLWQVNGRNAVGFEEMVRLDLRYTRERNFFYDLKIVLRTIPLMFGDKNAS